MAGISGGAWAEGRGFYSSDFRSKLGARARLYSGRGEKRSPMEIRRGDELPVTRRELGRATQLAAGRVVTQHRSSRTSPEVLRELAAQQRATLVAEQAESRPGGYLEQQAEQAIAEARDRQRRVDERRVPAVARPKGKEIVRRNYKPVEPWMVRRALRDMMKKQSAGRARDAAFVAAAAWTKMPASEILTMTVAELAELAKTIHPEARGYLERWLQRREALYIEGDVAICTLKLGGLLDPGQVVSASNLRRILRRFHLTCIGLRRVVMPGE